MKYLKIFESFRTGVIESDFKIPYNLILYNNIGVDMVPIYRFSHYSNDYTIHEKDEKIEYCKIMKDYENVLINHEYISLLKLLYVLEEILSKYDNAVMSDNYFDFKRYVAAFNYNEMGKERPDILKKIISEIKRKKFNL